MGVNQYPVASTALIKSIQRGVAASAGNITITAVDTTKTTVRSFSTGASGTVQATGTLGGTSTFPNNVVAGNGTIPTNAASDLNGLAYASGYAPASRYSPGYNYTYSYAVNGVTQNTRTIAHAGTLSGGTTDLTAAKFGVYLSNSTTLVATGPCRYEVIEFS
jgi:hypothetical protein